MKQCIFFRMLKTLVLHTWIINCCLQYSNICVDSNEIVMEHISVQKHNTFEMTFSETSKLMACTVVSPYNGIYTVDYRNNQALYEGGRIFVAIEDKNKCVTIVKSANESDVGKWRMTIPSKGINWYTNKNKVYGIHLTEESDPSTSAISHLYTRTNYTFAFIATLIIMMCILSFATVFIVLRCMGTKDT